MGRKRLRRIATSIHTWLGLLLGGLFVLVGLTGSVLVFYPALDLVLNPSLRAPGSETVAVDVDAVYQALRAGEPRRRGPWRIELPYENDGPIKARYSRPLESRDRSFSPLMLTMDPRTLEITSRRYWGDYAVTWIYDLHYTLLAESAGRMVIAVLGIVFFVLVALGVALWWPSPRRWRAALSIKRGAAGARRVYDLHTVISVWALPVTLTLIVSGVMLEQPGWFKPAIRSLSPLTPNFSAADPHYVLVEPPAINGDTALAAARNRFPNARLRWVETPGDGHPAWRIQLMQAGEPGARFPRTQVWVDSRSGAVMSIRDPSLNAAGDVLLDWLHPLHSGEAFGLPGRLLVFIGGLVPALAFTTGVLRWQRKRKARRGRSANAPSC